STITQAAFSSLTQDTAWTTSVPTATHTTVTASANSYTVASGSPLTVAAPGVLGNDSASPANLIGALLVTGPAHGTLSLQANGSFASTPNANFKGSDSFTYQAHTGSAASATTTVTLTVTDRPPTAQPDFYAVLSGGALHVAAAGVLANDTDPENGPL